MDNRTLGNKYEIMERLGRGGMAEVYRATHVTLDRQVAIKILHEFLADDPEFKRRFEKEARNIARLKHPNIVQVYDFEYDANDESYYMVMELVNGITLKDRLRELESTSQTIALTEALRITREAASALAYAHQAGMIHRDVKPANLLLDQHDNNRVVLTDFGIAKMITSAHYTVTGGIIGTPAYMAPEQGVGETGDERSDLYSLGVILYQMVTGQLPYDAETPLALILKHLNEPIPLAFTVNPSLPNQVDTIISRLMAKAPDDRYQNATEVIMAISNLEHYLKTENEETIIQPTRLPGSEPESRLSQVKAQRISGELDRPTYTPVPLKPDTPLPAKPKTQERPKTQPLSPVPKSKKPSATRRRWIIGGGIVGAFIILIAGYIVGANGGMFPAVGFLASDTPSPEVTAEVTEQATIEILAETQVSALLDTDTPTATSSATHTLTLTSTHTPNPTETPTATAAPTEVPPTHTSLPTSVAAAASLTPNMTQTLSAERTATNEACIFDYAIIEQVPEDGEAGGFYQINIAYRRVISLLNTGTCTWERNTSLTFINGSGESFNAGPRIFFREPVEVGAEVNLIFEGRLPSRGSQTPYSGTWQLRTPGQLSIGEPFDISVLVYDPGR